jgi:hypothetical protein
VQCFAAGAVNQSLSRRRSLGSRTNPNSPMRTPRTRLPSDAGPATKKVSTRCAMYERLTDSRVSGRRAHRRRAHGRQEPKDSAEPRLRLHYHWLNKRTARRRGQTAHREISAGAGIRTLSGEDSHHARDKRLRLPRTKRRRYPNGVVLIMPSKKNIKGRE